MTTGGLSPFTSCADGLGILPSAESLDHRSVYSLALTGSTCTISSIADPDGTRGRSRTKTMRTKEIEKSPIPHRFHLVPAGRRRLGAGSSLSPKPSTTWRFKECGDGGETESVYSMRSPSLYDFDVSPDPVQDDDELKPERSIIEGLISDALQSPVFESYRPSQVDIDYVSSPQASSYTLVNEQSSKSKRFSSIYKSTQEFYEIDDVAPTEQVLEDALLLQTSQPSASLADLEVGEEDTSYDDDYDHRVHASHEDRALVDSLLVDNPESASGGADNHHDCVPSPEKAQSSSSSHILLDSSLSSYSVHSDRSNNSAPRPAPSDSMRSMLSRRATEMSFGSAYNLPSPSDRRFALRRQAIYADYGFQIAFPESDSDSSLPQGPHHHSPTKPHKKGHAVGGRAASASAYVFSASDTGIPRSAWSTSTSGASLKSVTDPADGASPYISPLPSRGALNLAQANDKLEGLSVQDGLLASSRLPLADADGPGLKTSTPPLSLKSRSLRWLAQDPSSRTSGISAVSAEVHGSSGSSRCIPRPLERPWAPLCVTKRDSSDPLVLCLPVSRSDRAERFAIWQNEPGHHPIVEALLGEVRRAIEEWKGIGAVMVYF
ncbi:hypothetical protein K466DRAFT_662586 [Polyporus arcularius HHB13444]|uniref:Uncharacterized protein n=1 Tax=Polyporus arcularius HHB13444 TaxID=1314778 RepID=A0A5C3PEA9_9APHY|nr:hypothetical protein K466DRAFT_662586 [Polyporus arcularius HHB13444]